MLNPYILEEEEEEEEEEEGGREAHLSLVHTRGSLSLAKVLDSTAAACDYTTTDKS